MFGGLFFFLFLIILLCFLGSTTSSESIAYLTLTLPFPENTYYVKTSDYGYRIDPIDKSNISFHSGIDLSAPEGTDIVASADGEVVATGYQENGLGNYVYLKHDLSGITLYTMYGHMLDDSIVVSVGDIVKKKDKLGTIGSTGRSTGIHCHFMISVNKLSFKQEDLLDPIIVVEGLK